MKKKFFALPYIVWMILFTVMPLIPVSYTHLDVYKRQYIFGQSVLIKIYQQQFTL